MVGVLLCLLEPMLTTGNIVSIGCQAHKVLFIDVTLEGAQAVGFIDIPQLQLTVCWTAIKGCKYIEWRTVRYLVTILIKVLFSTLCLNNQLPACKSDFFCDVSKENNTISHKCVSTYIFLQSALQCKAGRIVIKNIISLQCLYIYHMV